MMGTDPGTNPNDTRPRDQEDPSRNERDPGDEGSSDHGGGLTASDAMAAADNENQAADVAKLITAIDPLDDGKAIGAESAETGDLPGDDDLLGALASMPSITVSNIDHTLDQLTTSTDLFDVPALDFYDDLPTGE
jgi:hypothetical protein